MGDNRLVPLIAYPLQRDFKLLSQGRFEAMADLNKVFLIGRLTQDPILRRTPSTGSAVSDLRLATSRVYTTRDGQRKEDQLYIDVTVWNRQAENCCEYLKKGSQVHVEGHLRMETWEDKNTGDKRSKIKVEADRVQFLDRRGDTGSSGGSYGGSGAGGYGEDQDNAPDERDYPESPSQRPSSAPDRSDNGAGQARGFASGPPRRPSPSPHDEEDGPEDDIPF
ncbi:single-stranded DNA-binding protein [soil metagenome]